LLIGDWFKLDMFARNAKYKIKGTSNDIKDFVEGTIDTISYINTETKELIKETKQDFQNQKKELKNDIKEDIYRRNYKVGKFVDGVDRLTSTTKNGYGKIRKIIKPNDQYEFIYRGIFKKKVDEYLAPSDHIKVGCFGYTHHEI